MAAIPPLKRAARGMLAARGDPETNAHSRFYYQGVSDTLEIISTLVSDGVAPEALAVVLEAIDTDIKQNKLEQCGPRNPPRKKRTTPLSS